MIVLPLAVRLIPPGELGLWYVFVALGGFASLLEVGFRQAVSLNTSYLTAGADNLSPVGLPGAINEDRPFRERLAPLVKTFVLFYQITALVVLLLLLIAGSAWIWRQTASLPGRDSLRMAWFFFAAGFAVNFSGSIWSAFLIGINRYRETQQAQLLAAVVGIIVSITGLLAGWRVWSLVAGQAATGFLTWILVRRNFLNAVPGLCLSRYAVDWALLRTLWPFAWRNGVGSVGAFLVTHANTLICSAVLDLQTTASFGLSMQLSGTLIAVSSMWVQVKLPSFARIRLQHGHRAVAPLFISRIAGFLATFMLGALCLLFMGQTALDLIGSKTPLLPLWPFALLMLVAMLEAHHSQYAALVLTENKNPFVVIGLISGVLSVILSALLVKPLGVLGLVVAPGLVQACGNNWWVVWRGIRGMDLTLREYIGAWRTTWINEMKRPA